MLETNERQNSILEYIRSAMLYIYVRRHFLEDKVGVLEFAQEITDIFNYNKLEFGAVKDDPKSLLIHGDTLIV